MLAVCVIHPQKSLEVPKGCILEWRLDLWPSVNNLSTLSATCKRPVIFTLRKKKSEESMTFHKMEAFAKLQPAYFDLEHDTPLHVIENLRKAYPGIKWIISYHNFDKTPNLRAILEKLYKIPADFYKIACKANSTLDALSMLQFVGQNGLIGVSMGEHGVITRILGPMMGAPWTYASLNAEDKTAEGQLTMQEITSVYGIERLSTRSAVYGLIGGPQIQSSIGHYTHNQVMKTLNLDAVYVKMQLAKDELPAFFRLVNQLPFQGFSVTMPLKQEVIRFLDEVDSDAKIIGAVNTLAKRQGRWCGYNTDGMGALDAIEERSPIVDKRLLIIGAGGAARAIVFEAKKRGAVVYVCSRTYAQAERLAETFGVESSLIDHLPEYDIVVNTTPSPLPIEPSQIQRGSVVMDITTVPQMTHFLQIAAQKGCTLVYGYEMFIKQGTLQWAHWFPSIKENSTVYKLMEKEALRHLKKLG